jgi:hypothetical protein
MFALLSVLLFLVFRADAEAIGDIVWYVDLTTLSFAPGTPRYICISSNVQLT